MNCVCWYLTCINQSCTLNSRTTFRWKVLELIVKAMLYIASHNLAIISVPHSILQSENSTSIQLFFLRVWAGIHRKWNTFFKNLILSAFFKHNGSTSFLFFELEFHVEHLSLCPIFPLFSLYGITVIHPVHSRRSFDPDSLHFTSVIESLGLVSSILLYSLKGIKKTRRENL